MEKNPYTDRITHLQNEYRKNKILDTVIIIAKIVELVACLVVVVLYIIHWITNDNLTSMQVLKWSLANYWFVYIYVIVLELSRNVINDQLHYSTRIQFDLIEALEKGQKFEKEQKEERDGSTERI